ncbi:hypothetical protein [Rhodococcus sp. AG1013]|nr:hypothetical protein [Rhodococcus sp. AG1013]RDI16645.1 hypothetical protein DEU38_1257 [Rhodococcus sp. AG1013]
MGSLGSVATALDGETGAFLRPLIGMLIFLPFGFSVDFNWMPPFE